ncbi:hypothetical protein [Oceanobacillus kapialis]|uniref:DUF3221 domain-containing protein n=1 Tax=Oceanobacillus kapialis TaxID=481353 RepID=A0ABW5Q2S2_9BACI
MIRVVAFMLVIVMLGACGEQNNESASEEIREEGVIVHIEKSDTFEGDYLLLTLPSLENTNVLNKTREELIKLAQENNGAFYVVTEEKYEELNLAVGKTIVGYYDGEGESDPPVRFTDKIEVKSSSD